MKLIPITDIKIAPDRQRQSLDMEHEGELVNSIFTHGLLHPIALRSTPEGMTLVAGETRLRAVTSLAELGTPIRCNGQAIPLGMIPYMDLGELDPLSAEEVELDENLKRKDLTWQERSAAIARLHHLRQAQAELAGTTHSVADTAEELRGRSDGYYQDTVRQDIILAEHLDKPEVAKAKTSSEAMKILKKVETAERAKRLGEIVGESYQPALALTLLQGNCLDHMQSGSLGKFDCIMTDPPYGMGAHKFDSADGRAVAFDHEYDDSLESWEHLMDEFIPLTWDVTKEQAHAYIMCDIDQFPTLRDRMRAVGWRVFRTPLIHVKINAFRAPWPNHGPRRTYECILFAIRGDRPVIRMAPDVTETPSPDETIHGAAKPVPLYVELLSRSCQPGDRIYDPFAGSGTIFPAAKELQLFAVGSELNPSYYGLCVERIQSLCEPK